MAQTESHLDLPLEDVLSDRFGRYSKYIIQERALPDVRDGLKPVQRRILYAMYKENNTHEHPFRKSAKTVGNVIGNYHPHGDSSVYEAMVRMSQDWKLRNVLVEMHGNNGSVDGDPPAAMRYTEARLSAIAAELLQDIDKNTVEFVPNFDDTLEEPAVLPASFPNLLVNGSTGISAGYATDIPPHHLGEVIDGAILLMEKPDATLEELMQHIQGPDFPTGGIVLGVDGMKKAYETGKGKIILRAKTEIEPLKGGRQQIVITEIPYDVNKANLVKKIDEIRFEKKIDGIAEVRDDTDRTGLRIVVELKKDADAETILNYLLKNTELQITYNFNMVAIHKKRPCLMGLKDILQAYIDHQKEVVTRRSQFELKKAEERQHIVHGLIKAISVLDDVIQTIRASKDKKDAKNHLIAKFSFTEPQAEAIVNLQLYRLTNTDITALEKEAKQLEKKIAELYAILGSEKKLIQVIKKELLQIKNKFADERRTEIREEAEEIKINYKKLIASEDVIVSVTKEGYVKRTSLRSYAASSTEEPEMKENDYLLGCIEANTQDTLLLFTKKGNYLYIPIYELPDIRWKDSGQHVNNLVVMERDDEIIAAQIVKHFSDSEYVLFITKHGLVKRTPLSHFIAQRHSKALVAMKLKNDDEVVNVHFTNGNKEVFLATHFGYGLWFSEEEINVVGLRAAGVKGINLKQGDFVVNGLTFSADEEVQFYVITHRAAAKKLPLAEFEKYSRAKRGLIMLRELKKNPHRLIAFGKIHQGQLLKILTSYHQVETAEPELFIEGDRYQNGATLFSKQEKGEIIAVWEHLQANK